MRTIEAVLGRPRVGHRVCRTVGPAVLVAEFVNLQTFTNPLAALVALVAEFVNLQTFTNPVAAVAPAALVAEFVNLQTFTNSALAALVWGLLCVFIRKSPKNVEIPQKMWKLQQKSIAFM